MGLKSDEIGHTAYPGQFVMIRVGTRIDPLLRRPFSICGIREDGGVMILYRVVGRGTRMMAAAKAGDALDVLGPLGKGFDAPDPARVPFLVTGGMGIAPLSFLAQRLGPNGHLLTGYACADQQVPLHRFGASHCEVSVATEDGSAGYHGMVTTLLEEILRQSPEGVPDIYACGPVPMLKAVAALALKKGIPCRVSLESTMACGLGACQGCAVAAAPGRDRAYYHVCRDGPVFDVNAIDWERL